MKNISILKNNLTREALTLLILLTMPLTASAIEFFSEVMATTPPPSGRLITLTPQALTVSVGDGDILTGTGGTSTKVSIVDGATVTLRNVSILNVNNFFQWPGLTCLGDAVIILEEGTTNSVEGGEDCPGIFVPEGKTLTIQGSGTLNTTGGDKGAGIGSGYMILEDVNYSSCGNIIISGGTITATGQSAAGIGSGKQSDCGNITISGGDITALGGDGGAGIGCGQGSDQEHSSCGTITISGGNVTATGGGGGAGIGSGYVSDGWHIYLSGGTITATGGFIAAGIGSGNHSSCQTITITNGVTMVTATAGKSCAHSIGEGMDSTCGIITIGIDEIDPISQSPFTTFPYTVSFDANGGIGVTIGNNTYPMGNATFMYNMATTLPENLYTRPGYLFEGWATSPSGPKVYDDEQNVSNLAQTSGETVTLYAKWIFDPAHLSVSGDEYTIHTTTGWDLFCEMIANNSAGFFTGKTVKIADNITVTTMAGTRTSDSDYLAFTGTFDGQGHTLTLNYSTTLNDAAPFRVIDGATIQNLHIAGTIGTSGKFAGVVGHAYGTCNLTNCRSSITINSTVNGDGTHGGFVGVIGNGATSFTGCVFDGAMLGASTTLCGGFVGWTESNHNATATITNCLFAPTNLTISSGYTFSRARNLNSVTLTNSYYTEPLGTPQGTLAINNTAVQPLGNPTATYNVSKLALYSNGIQYGTTFYYNPNRNFLLDIEGYGYESNPGGWYLIASPVVEDIAPSDDNGFITNEYDLYSFDQSFVGEEWRNHKVHDFLLTNGTGYLYASEQATTLTFSGTPYAGNGELELAYNPNVPDFAGWNLVGNPFAETAYVARDFYVLNDERSEVVPSTESTVEAMEGIFVVADYDGETMTFSPISKGTRHEERIVLNLTRNNGTVIDRAIVRFGEGKPLPKFQINPNHTKVYIPQDGKDYAIVCAGGDGACTVSTGVNELPVHFKAEHNGTYTLTVLGTENGTAKPSTKRSELKRKTENPQFSVLRLIDNITGADIDLLQTPSYTFTARTTDYESRFKLVFMADEGAGEAACVPFAFVSDGKIIVNGTGTVQVIDMLGRIVVQRGDGACTVSTDGMALGIYVIRLIQGKHTKTQKIVIQ